MSSVECLNGNVAIFITSGRFSLRMKVLRQRMKDAPKNSASSIVAIQVADPGARPSKLVSFVKSELIGASIGLASGGNDEAVPSVQKGVQA